MSASPEVARQRLIENSIRRGVKRSKAYWEFLSSQPVVLKGKYRYYPCARCEEYFSRFKLDLDHVVPVVDPELGFQGWDSYVERSYCAATGFQHLCRPCHKVKTKAEGKTRTTARQTKKALPATSYTKTGRPGPN